MLDQLHVYYNSAQPTAALNMAIDEAIFLTATVPAIRFYGWSRPALSFGYFGKFSEAAKYGTGREVVRRWTGGGIVFHGDDLTYAMIIPNREAVFAESPNSIYEKIHRALCDALSAGGVCAELAAVAGVAGARAAVNDSGYNKGHCFANPVRADVLINGQKIAGAAQRRTRVGLLQQGSIRYDRLPAGFAEQFAHALCRAAEARSLEESLRRYALKLSEEKYAAQTWLHKR